MPNKELLLRYAELKLQQNKIEEEIELLKPAVLLEVEEIKYGSDEPVALAELPGYSFTIEKGRKKWTYGDHTTALIAEAEKRKKEEQKLCLQEGRGPASYVEGEPILVFNTPRS